MCTQDQIKKSSLFINPLRGLSSTGFTGILFLLQICTATLSAFLDNVTTVLLIVPVTLAITKKPGENAIDVANALMARVKALKNTVDELRRQVERNPGIVAIMLINPDNPTGMVYPRGALEAIVAVARETNFASRMVLGAIGMTLAEEFVQAGQPMTLYESVVRRG